MLYSTPLLTILVLLLLLPSVAGTPTGVTANRTGYTSASVSWTAPSTGTPPAGYEVFYELTVGDKIDSKENTTSNTELTLTGLTLGSYSIFVVSFGAEGHPVLPSKHSQPTTVMIGKHYQTTLSVIFIVFVQIFLGCHLPQFFTQIPVLL